MGDLGGLVALLGMHQYPGGVPYIGEIRGVAGRSERDLCSQLGMSAAAGKVGRRGDLEDVQSGEEN